MTQLSIPDSRKITEAMRFHHRRIEQLRQLRKAVLKIEQSKPEESELPDEPKVEIRTCDQ